MIRICSDITAPRLATGSCNLPTAFLSVSANKRLDVLNIKAITGKPEILEKTILDFICNKICRVIHH